ncbi:MAG: DNA repair exonuclease [Deltaproteobacteria bacterium]|nr:DNA repair exonuclease [Deltaproteobacteria bacterium]
MKFVHAADLHIDSPLRGLERYEGAPVERVRGATRRAFENLVELCLAEEAAFLLLAGDIFDGDWKDYGTGLFFVAQVARLGHAGIPTYLVRGNHDAASQVTKYLSLPSHIYELGSRAAETKIVEAHGVAIHGQSFATRAVTDDLAMDYPQPVRGLFNIGLLHTCVEGRVGHEPYAPCSVAGLKAKGYDYWALGHVHTREVLATAPWIVFPGNLQGRHARESGPKGATVVTVSDGRVIGAEPRALDVVRWMTCDVDASEAASADDAVDAARAVLEAAVAQADGRLVVAPIVLRARSAVHSALLADAERWTQQLRAIALDVVGDGLWMERVRFAAIAQKGVGVGAGDSSSPDQDAVAQFVRAVRGLRDDPVELAKLTDEFVDLKRKLPSELREGQVSAGQPSEGQISDGHVGDPGLHLEDPATLRRLLNEVESLVVGRLTGRGGDSA